MKGLRERACQICANVVDDHQRTGKQEPDDAIEDVGHKEGRGHENKQQNQVHPGVLAKLHQVVSLLQLQYKGYKPCTASLVRLLALAVGFQYHHIDRVALEID